MKQTGEFFCMVSSDSSETVNVTGKQTHWRTFTWIDEFGNSIAPFFTSQDAGRSFLEELSGWELKRYPASFVVTVILADLKQETSFYTIDPVTVREFKALSAVEFLTELIYRKQPTGSKAHTTHAEHAEIVPLQALFGAGSEPECEEEYRQLLSMADVIFGIDVNDCKQTILFGRQTLEDLVRTGQCPMLGIVNIGLEHDVTQIEKLTDLIKDIKGYHDYLVTDVTV